MGDPKETSWGEGERRELLCLMMIGSCVWIAGTQLGLFSALLDLMVVHQFQDLIMLALCMSLGVVAAAIRKSFQLRRVMLARDGAQAQAAAAARHDALTGLANRRLFQEILARRLDGDAAIPTLAVMLIDLDRFKPVNELHGHAVGDTVLCMVADRIRSIVPSGNAVARLGGDEFAVMLDFRDEPDQIGHVAQNIIVALSKPVSCGPRQIEISATIGIALASAQSRSAEVLLHAADVAMYQGKRDGRGIYRFFHNEMGDALRARAELERELGLAIPRGEIEPFYQPVVSLPGRELIGFEVLARWRHPERGLLGPAAFIALAEETGMIADLTWSLLRRACLDARSWPVHLQLAVNISPLQLQDPDLPERILAILNETEFSPHRLEIEITETALVNDLEAARTTLAALQKLGMRIALDDFGTGYSSLGRLRELQFDKLKIDRSYVASIAEGAERAKLVDAIIALGSSLGLVTTAEGIETTVSVDWLADQGCTYGQGFLFGGPVDKSTTDGLLGVWSDPAGRIVLAPAPVVGFAENIAA